jgi:hypothetical protein
MSIEFLEPLTNSRTHDAMKRTLRDLTPNSEMLKILRETLTALSSEIRFITCVEQKLTQAPVSDKLSGASRCSSANLSQSIEGQAHGAYHAVDNNGARLYRQSEEIISIQADHREMVKFSSKGDRHYLQVLRQLRKALEDCRSVRREP